MEIAAAPSCVSREVMLSKKLSALQDLTFTMQNPAEPFFKTPPPPPNTHFLCKILLPETETKRNFPSLASTSPTSLQMQPRRYRPPSKTGFSCLVPRRWSRPAGCKAPPDLPARWRHLEGTRGATRCEAPPASPSSHPPMDLPAPPGAPMGGRQLAPQGHGDPLAPRPLSPRCTLSHAHPVIDVAVLCSNL